MIVELEKLQKEKDQLMERVRKIDTAMKAFRDVCSHKTDAGHDAMRYTGHDSHKRYYECSLCGHEYDV